ncbi:MAG: hypothetical protein AAFP13_13770 [Pseudomonadota bacterium]
MTTHDPPLGPDRLHARWDRLLRQLDRYIDAVEAQIDKLAEGDFSEAGAFTKVKAALTDTAKALNEAETKIDQQRQRDEGGVPGAGRPIDMDAARDEIGRRLDRIRRARGAEGVS